MRVTERAGAISAAVTLGLVVALVMAVIASNTPVYANSSPNLEVEGPVAGDENPYTGASFTLSVTVTNIGDRPSAETTLRYYRSTDATITTSDVEVATAAIGALAANATSTQSNSLTAPSSAGTYYYGACVDAVTGESDTTDNCSTAVEVTVRLRPDLSIRVGYEYAAPLNPGGSLNLRVVVYNRGYGQSATTTLRYYRSPNATITMSDIELGTTTVAAMAGSATTTTKSHHSISVTAPSSPGTFYYGACVDAVMGEANTDNNCRGFSLTLLRRIPNLILFDVSVRDRNVSRGESFTLSTTVYNLGRSGSASTTLRYYYGSSAFWILPSDVAVGTDAVGAIASEGRSEHSILLTAPSELGTYSYYACVDPVPNESNAGDNCSNSYPVSVVNSLATGPVKINGTAQVGHTLTADTSGISDADGMASSTFAYQWLADGSEIVGATSSTYMLPYSATGKLIQVRVSFTDDWGSHESVTSEATDAVVQPLAVNGITATSYAENGTSTAATYATSGSATSSPVTWSLTGNDSDDFSISTTGELRFSSPPDYESPTDSDMDNVYEVTVNAVAGDTTATLDVTVTVTDVNEGPSLMMNQ